MTDRIEGFNDGGITSIRGEVIRYLDSVVDVSPAVSYQLVEDDEKGQRFEVLVSDDEGISKGAINLTVVPVKEGSIISLSPYAPFENSEQSLSVDTVNRLLITAAQDVSLERRSIYSVAMFTTDIIKSFTSVEPVITEVLDKVSDTIFKARHDFNLEKPSATHEVEKQSYSQNQNSN